MKLKTSEVFRRVRMHLRDGGAMQAHQRYICFAINALYFMGMVGDVDRTRAKCVIRAQLQGKKSLEQWLFDNHNITGMGYAWYDKKIMATRKAWLTHLIEHYEAKGD